MNTRSKLTLDANEGVAHVAYRLNEVMAIYPITPSSPMPEFCDQWASEGKKNLWGTIPSIVELESEGGAVGTVHGALQTGSIATTFTASQGLLLMIPNMFKIAGELLPTVFHVTARAVATHALSIFGDHSDIMACRSTGWAMLGSASVQEAHDFALIAQAATLRSRIPFVHFFDGFRTSHEVQKIEMLSEADLHALIDDKLIAENRKRAMTPDHPVLRGTAQNADAFFQGREACNPFYAACPGIVQEAMDEFAKQVGHAYKLFEYFGAPDAEHVIVLMGSGCEAVHETVENLNKRGAKLGVIKVRLYRPFDGKRFVEALPRSVKAVAVLDRTKEPGATGEPLYQDCMVAILEGMSNGWGNLKWLPKVVGGRYGLSSKEFTPAMVKAVFDNLAADKPRNHFTVGITDDVSNTSLPVDHDFSTEPDNVIRALFYGLGADGTVGANKNSIKIIGESTGNFAQGYFVYDSKKSGSMTVSHLRFGPEPIRSTYLITRANFVACHQPMFLEKYDMAKPLVPGGTFLLNTPYPKDEIWSKLPTTLQESLIARKAKFYVIDATKVARDSGMGGRINTIMQVCFFALSGVLPRDKAIESIKYSIKKTYGKKGEEIVAMNLKAVDNTLEHLHEVPLPNRVNGSGGLLPPISLDAPKFVRDVLGRLAVNEGDVLPVSAFPADGTFPTGTAQYEKRNLALDIPVWDEKVCIQCLKCVAICPHATIRAKVYEPAALNGAPATFKSTDAASGIQGLEILAASRRGGLHGLLVVRGRLPRPQQNGNKTQGHQHADRKRRCGCRSTKTGISSSPCPNWTGEKSRRPSFANSSSCGRCSNSPARAPAAARRHTSKCSPSFSATAPSSPTPPAVPRFTAATCPRRPIAWIKAGAGRRGAIRCSRTTRSSASVSAFRLTNKRNLQRNLQRNSRRNWATTS